MDLSKLSTSDLTALRDKNLSGVSTDGLRYLQSQQTTEAPAEEPKGPTVLPEEDTSSDFVRGIKSYLPSLRETANAAEVGAGLIAKKLGAEETGKGMIQSGIKGMGAAKEQQVTKESDSFSNAWEKGIGSVIADYLPYQIGAGVGNITESLLAAGVGGAMGSVAGPAGAVPGAITGLLEKSLVKSGVRAIAEKIAKEEGEAVAEQYVKKEAGKIVGAAAGMVAQAGVHGVGETTGRAVEEAQKEGMTEEEGQKAVENIDMGKLAPAMLAHGVADFVAEKIGLAGFKGFSDVSTKNVIADVLKNIATTGGKEILPEEIQSVAERYGANLSLADAEATKEYLDTAAASIAMSVAPGGIGGARTYYQEKAIADDEKLAAAQAVVDKEDLDKETIADEAEKVQPQDKDFADLISGTKPAVEEVKVAAEEEKTAETEAKVAEDERLTREKASIDRVLTKEGIDPTQEFVNKEGNVVTAAEHYKNKRDTGAVHTHALNSIKSRLTDTTAQDLQDAKDDAELTKVAEEPVEVQENEYTKNNWYDKKLNPKGTELPPPPAEVKAIEQQQEETKAPEVVKTEEQKQEDIFDTAWDTEASERTPEQTKIIQNSIDEDARVKAGVQDYGKPLEEKPPEQKQEKVKAQKQKGELTPVLNAIELNQVKNIKKPGYVPPKQVIEPLAKKILGEEFNADYTPEQMAAAVREKIETSPNIISTEDIAKGKKDSGNALWDLLDEGNSKGIQFVKGLKKTKEPSADNYLNQNHYTGREAPLTVAKGVQHAAIDIANDRTDSIDITSLNADFKKKADDAMNKINSENKAGRELVTNKAKKEKWTEGELKKELSKYKDKKFTASKPLDYMTMPEVINLYKEHTWGKANWTKDNGGAQREQAILDRHEFLKQLPPEKRKTIEAETKTAFINNIKADLTGREVTRNRVTKESLDKNEAVTAKKLAEEELLGASEDLLKEVVYNADQKQSIAAKVAKLNKELNEEDLKQVAKETIDAYRETKLTASTRALQSAISEKEDVTFTEVLNNIANLGYFTNKPIAQGLLKLVDALSTNGISPKVTFKIGKLDSGVNGQFDPTTNTITVNGKDGYFDSQDGRSLEDILLHEMTHYLTDHVVDNKTAYIKSIKDPVRKEQVKKAFDRLEVNYNVAKASFGKEYNIESMKEFIAETMSNKAFQRALRTLPSENPFVKAMNLFGEIAQNIAISLGFKQGTSSRLAETLEDIISIAAIPAGTRKGAISFAKQAKNNVGIKSAFDKTGKSALLQPKVKKLSYIAHRLGTVDGWTHTVHAIQNDRYFAKRWQDAVDLAGKLVEDPRLAFNNIYDQLTLAPQVSLNYRKKFIIKPVAKIQEDLKKLNTLLGNDIDTTLNMLHSFKLGLNGKERRLTKFVMTVELDARPILQTNSGRRISPQDRRFEIIGDKSDPTNPAKGILDDPRLTAAQAKQLRAEVDGLVASYAKPLDAKIDGDINNSKYNTLGESAQQENAYIAEYNDLAVSNPQAYNLTKKIFTALEELNNNTKTMDKEANYWSKPVNNWVEFYGWKDYSPFKGNPAHSKVDPLFDLDTFKQGKEYQDFARAWGGRGDDAENVVLQTIADSSRAADRAGRKNLTQSIINAVRDGSIDAKIEMHIPFSDRTSAKNLSTDMRLLHYNEDGSIDVIKFEPSAKKILESIRRTYSESHPFWDVANGITSFIGQAHTRYNYNFAPLNFVRDILTNAWVMGANFGPKKSAEFIATVASKVIVNKGLFKAWKVSKLYENNDFAKLKALAKTDPYIRDMVSYIDHGGKVAYMESLGVKSNYEELVKLTGKSGLLDTKAKIDHFVNIWNEMFEIASRSAAYGIVKKTYVSKGLTEEAAGVKAAAYVKNLANFEQVGEYGKQLGALYMFARPAATGAVRSIEAIAPAFSSPQAALERQHNSGVFSYKEVNGKRVYSNPSAITKFKENYKGQQVNARNMTCILAGLGIAAYTMSIMTSDNDDDERNKTATDNMDQWAKFARFHLTNPFTDEPMVFQIPWGFGLGAIASSGAQLSAVVAGNASIKEALKNIFLQISLDSFAPIPVSRMDPFEDQLEFAFDSFCPSTARPLLEFILNKNGLGQDIYKETMGSSSGGDAYNRGDKVPEMYNNLAAYLADATNGEIDITPNSLYFFANSYVDGASRVLETIVNTATPDTKAYTPRELPLLGSFFGTESSIDAREFGKMEDQIKAKRGLLKMYETNPEQYGKYVTAHPMDPAIVATYDKIIGGTLNELYHTAKLYRQMKGLSPKEREALIKPITLNINIIKNHLNGMFKAYGMEPD
jgi:hypothetical protein